jgi:hypothetical protein
MPESSFRDPSGFLFEREGVLFRQVNNVYRENYEFLLASRLYEELVDNGLLIAHREVTDIPQNEESFYKIIQPDRVPFISYPYEWCFSQLKNAALTTLRIQKIALGRGMTLKDASAYNIQYFKGKPIFIDTLSFEKYREGEPWIAYRQFCQHFLAPLALMSLKDIHLSQLLRIYIDGIPLDLAGKLLPLKSLLCMGLLTNIHLHAKMQEKHSDKSFPACTSAPISKRGLLKIIIGLEESVQFLHHANKGTEWGDYYRDIHYSAESFEAKKRIISELIAKLKPNSVWDLGANEGVFSRLSSSQGIYTISIDNDPLTVEKNYLTLQRNDEICILPLLIDLTNPTSFSGWGNRERRSLVARGPADIVMVLALEHHLVIGNNVPFKKLAEFLAQLGRWLIIEYIPKEDIQVQRLLAFRKDIFNEYSKATFEQAFGQLYNIKGKYDLPDSHRVIYFMAKES